MSAGEFERFPAQFYRLVVLPREVEHPSQGRVEKERERIKFQGLLLLSQGLLQPWPLVRASAGLARRTGSPRRMANRLGEN